MKKSCFLFYSFIAILLLLIIEQGLSVSYLVKTMTKIILFLGIPFFLLGQKGFTFLHLQRIQWNDWKVFLSFGTAIVVVIITTFIGLRSFLDLDDLLVELNNIGVTKTTFPFVALYILFGNSLLEEFFFRGLLPSIFNRKQFRLLVPSLLFALYHIAIFFTWFTWPLLILATIGLWVGGILFQLVNEKSGTIFPSWTIHICADLSILLIGTYLLYIY